jgi:hypothetical protein
MGKRSDRFSAIGKRRGGINAEDAESAEFAEKTGDSVPQLARRFGAYTAKARVALSQSNGPVPGDSFVGELFGIWGER